MRRFLRLTIFTFVLGLVSAVVRSQPVITNFSPQYGAAGTTITITGSNFSTTPTLNSVYFGHIKATVDSSYANVIYVRVPRGAQYRKISVTTGGKTAWTKYPFKFQNPCAPSLYNSSFKAPFKITGWPFAPKPSAVSIVSYPLIADFDKDGKPDIATVCHGSPSYVAVCRNMGTIGNTMDSTFFPYTARSSSNATVNPTMFFPVAGTQATSIDAVDFDCDGSQDIIVAGNVTPSVSILRNTGSSGTISFATNVPITTSTQPNYATGADLDGDGKPEIVLVTGGSTSLLNILRNNTTPGSIISTSFVSPTTYALAGAGGSPYLDFDDIDGDGKLDIAVACSTGGVISIFRNTSTGVGVISFAARLDITTGNYPFCVRLMDMNGDNKPDIVCSRVKTPIAGPTSPTIGPDSLYNVYRNVITVPGSITAASFASAQTYALRSNPLIFDLADLDGDLLPDIAAPNFLSNSLYVWRNQSTPSTINMTPRLNEMTSNMTAPTGVAIGDLNGDNVPDMVVTNLPTSAGQPLFFTIFEGQKPKAQITSLIGAPTCPGNTVKVVVTTSGAPYVAGNVFTVLLSDSLGSFASPTVVGTKTGVTSDTILVTIPANAQKVGGQYRLLINTSNPSVACVDTGYPIQVIAPPVANAGTDTTINIGDSVRLNATGAIMYNWNSSIFLGDTTVGNPYARPYYTTDFVVAAIEGFCRGYDTVRVTVTQNINSCNNCSPEYPMNSMLVGCYPFNGSAIDYSGNSNHLTFQNTPGTTDRNFANTTAYGFNGANSWMTRTPVVTDANDSVTMMCWAWQTLNNQNVPIIFIGVDSGSTASGYGLYMDGGSSGSPGSNISARIGATSTSNSSAQLQFQDWTHVALVKAGNNYSVYVGGSLIFTQSGTAGSIASGLLMVGGSPYRGASLLGKLDDVRIFKRALSATEIQMFYADNYKRFVVAGANASICQGDSVHLSASGANTYSWTYSSPGGGVSSSINSPTSASPWVNPVTAPGGNKTVYYVVTGTKTYCSDKDTTILSVDNYKDFADAGNNFGFCLGDSVQLGGSGCVTYSWSPNIAIDDVNSPIPYVHPSTTTDYILKGSFGNCFDYDTVNVRVDNFTNFVSAGSDTTICAGNGVTLHGSGADGYTWTPNTVSNRYIPDPTDAPTATTTYYLQANKGYCLDYDTVVVFVDQFANFLTVSYHDTSLCTGLSAYPYAGGATRYKWTPSTGVSDDTLAAPVITPNAGITYYTVTGTKGACVEKDSVKVNVDDYHNFLTASGDTTMCPGEFRPLFASGADSYLWYPSTADVITSPVIPNPYASPQTTTTYYITGSIGSCVEIDSVKITVGANSSASVDAGPDRTLCLGDTVHLSAKGVGAFTWEPTDGLSDPNIPNPVASPDVTRKYVLTIVDTGGVACKIFDTLTITVNTKPLAKITDPNPDSVFCKGSTVNLKAEIGTGYTYFWSASSPGDGIKSPISRTTPATPATSMTFTVRVYEISTQCTAYDSIFVTVVDPPIVDLGPDIAICRTDSIVLAPAKIENAISPTYKWTVIYDTLNLDYTTSTIKVSPYKKANVYLRLTEGKCISKVDTMNITVAPKVYAYFTTDPVRGPSPLYVGLSNGSIGADEFFWDFGDTLGIIGRQRDTTYSYNDTGYYRIILKARNSIGGCEDYDTAWVRVDDIVTFFVPSAFSPNGDGLNDRFEVNQTGVENYQGQIYNKWGQLIYSADTRKEKFSWDGKYNGEMVPTDIYYYVFDYVTFGDKQDSRSGTIYLSR